MHKASSQTASSPREPEVSVGGVDFSPQDLPNINVYFQMQKTPGRAVCTHIQ